MSRTGLSLNLNCNDEGQDAYSVLHVAVVKLSESHYPVCQIIDFIQEATCKDFPTLVKTIQQWFDTDKQ